MKIAIATEGNRVSQHFGRCEHFTIFEVEEQAIKDKQLLHTQGNQHGALPDFLANLGVAAIISGGMGGGAMQKLSQKSIAVYTGVRGSIDDVIQQFVNNELQPVDPAAESHDSHHGCHGHDHDGHHHGHACNCHH